MPDGISIAVKLMHPSKTPEPIDVTLSGRTISSSLLQPRNAPELRLVTPGSRITRRMRKSFSQSPYICPVPRMVSVPSAVSSHVRLLPQLPLSTTSCPATAPHNRDRSRINATAQKIRLITTLSNLKDIQKNPRHFLLLPF